MIRIFPNNGFLIWSHSLNAMQLFWSVIPSNLLYSTFESDITSIRHWYSSNPSTFLTEGLFANQQNLRTKMQSVLWNIKRKARKKERGDLTRKVGRSQDNTKKATESLHPGKWKKETRMPVTSIMITRTRETLCRSDILISGFCLSNGATVIKEPIRNNPEQVSSTGITFNEWGKATIDGQSKHTENN